MTLDVEVRVAGVHLSAVLPEVQPGIMKVCDRTGITRVVSLNLEIGRSSWTNFPIPPEIGLNYLE